MGRRGGKGQARSEGTGEKRMGRGGGNGHRQEATGEEERRWEVRIWGGGKRRGKGKG